MRIESATAPNARVAPPAVALNAMALPTDGESLPEWVPVVPAGHIVGRDGRSYINDDPQRVVELFAANRMPMVFDYEHGSELRAPRGKAAPAAGWVNELEARDGAVWGHVEWTERASAMLQAREYRFYSPALLIDNDAVPPRVVGLKSVGLTNQPNLDVPSLNHQQTEPVMNEAIRQALGLNDEATADDAVAAINSLKKDRDVALNSAKTPSLELFVPRADYNAALNRASTAEAELKAERDDQARVAIDTAIDAAIESKKISPATVEYHRAQCATEGGLERFKAYIDQAPVIAGDTDLGTRKPEGKVALNAEAAHVAKLLGKPVELFTNRPAQ